MLDIDLWFDIFRGYFNPGLIEPHSLQTRSEKEEYLSMIKDGHLDIIVGTHSLLGSRVVYNNLGLLVVDEEQVFRCIPVFTFCYVPTC